MAALVPNPHDAAPTLTRRAPRNEPRLSDRPQDGGDCCGGERKIPVDTRAIPHYDAIRIYDQKFIYTNYQAGRIAMLINELVECYYQKIGRSIGWFRCAWIMRHRGYTVAQVRQVLQSADGA